MSEEKKSRRGLMWSAGYAFAALTMLLGAACIVGILYGVASITAQATLKFFGAE